MIITRGWGILAILLPMAVMLIGISIFGEDGNIMNAILTYSFLISGPLVFILGIIFNKKSSSKHDMSFIPLQVWGIIWIVIGLVMFFTNT